MYYWGQNLAAKLALLDELKTTEPVAALMRKMFFTTKYLTSAMSKEDISNFIAVVKKYGIKDVHDSRIRGKLRQCWASARTLSTISSRRCFWTNCTSYRAIWPFRVSCPSPYLRKSPSCWSAQAKGCASRYTSSCKSATQAWTKKLLSNCWAHWAKYSLWEGWLCRQWSLGTSGGVFLLKSSGLYS